MRRRVTLVAGVLIILFLATLGCKHKKSEESSDADFGGFKANVNMKPRNVSVTQEQAAPAAPVLTPTSATIGPNGGTLASSDGKLSISVPAGAFASDTTVSVQPSEDPFRESLGPVYQLSPEGTTFAQPVKLVWHLSEADLSRTNLDNLMVRTQTANGPWEPQPDVQRDEATHTISVATAHFSKWDLALTLRLDPTENKVYVGDDTFIFAIVGESKYWPSAPDIQPNSSQATNQSSSDDDLLSAPPPKGSSEDDLLATPHKGPNDDDLLATPPDLRKGIFNGVWRVNGIPFGNSTVGTIKPIKNSQFNGGKSANIFGWFYAPAHVPSPNPVTVSYEITAGKQKMTATSLVTIVPYQDHWKGDSTITQGDGTKVTSQFTFTPVERPGGNPPSAFGPESAASATVHEYEILNGWVHYKGPATVSGGACTLKINPSFNAMEGAKGQPTWYEEQRGSGGRLVVDMSNPMQWLVTGQGDSVWLATYITTCPNGSGSIPMGVHAAWWPPDPTNPNTSTAFSIPLDPKWRPNFTINVNNSLGHGTVHLRYVDKPRLE